jgi:hypothetical protein
MPRKHSIVGKIDRPKARRSMLRKELEAVTLALAEEEKKLKQVLNVIKKMKEDMKAPVHEAIHLHK